MLLVCMCHSWLFGIWKPRSVFSSGKLSDLQAFLSHQQLCSVEVCELYTGSCLLLSLFNSHLGTHSSETLWVQFLMFLGHTSHSKLLNFLAFFNLITFIMHWSLSLKCRSCPVDVSPGTGLPNSAFGSVVAFCNGLHLLQREVYLMGTTIICGFKGKCLECS